MHTFQFPLLIIFLLPARIICQAIYPNGLLYANKAWTVLTKYEQHEIEGKSLACLYGPLTDTGRIMQVKIFVTENLYLCIKLFYFQMMHDVKFSGFGSTEVINYDKNMDPFLCRVTIQPIISQDSYGEYV